MGEWRRKRTPGRTQPSENSGYAPAVCQTITSETLLYEFFAHRLGLYFHRIRVKSNIKVIGSRERKRSQNLPVHPLIRNFHWYSPDGATSGWSLLRLEGNQGMPVYSYVYEPFRRCATARRV